MTAIKRATAQSAVGTTVRSCVDGATQEAPKVGWNNQDSIATPRLGTAGPKPAATRPYAPPYIDRLGWLQITRISRQGTRTLPGAVRLDDIMQLGISGNSKDGYQVSIQLKMGMRYNTRVERFVAGGRSTDLATVKQAAVELAHTADVPILLEASIKT